MAKVQLKHKSVKQCMACGKGDTMSLNRPHSLHKTKRVVKPNFQKKWGLELCQNCFRTVKKQGVDLSTNVQ
jgi:ribosomal protein L28